MPDKTQAKEAGGRDWSQTLFLPRTDFPMRAGLPAREPLLLAHWERLGLYRRLREAAKGRVKFVLHDGPPYANGNIHIGTGLNKILKDVVVRSQQMMGKDSNYVPGWDCHGLPIEWKIEEENYRAKGRQKPDLSDADALIAFRRECRDFAQAWIEVQRAEFKRLGVEGDWENPYTTMSFEAEAAIAAELTKFAMNGTLYRGSKPVMWSVVERTALAEAEVEYHEIESDQVWVKFPVKEPRPVGGNLVRDINVVIWTTTPWTIPGNRAIAYSPSIEYGLYEVAKVENDFGPQAGEKFLLAKSLSDKCAEQANLTLKPIGDVSANDLGQMKCHHPLRDLGFNFDVPLLSGGHVTDEAGTGFVHTAPGHGQEDFETWMANRHWLVAHQISPTIPYTVDEAGYFTDEAPGFEGRRIIDDKGKKGDANAGVIEALKEAGMLVARGRLKHDYPHSWRSKKPVIFRNTPQWFIALDKDIQEAGSGEGTTGTQGETLRARALTAISDTRWVPPQGENRIRGMIESRPDWVISRQRAWGVPIAVFVHKETGQTIPGPGFANSDTLIARIVAAFRADGADAWFQDNVRRGLLDGLVEDATAWEPVTDILDVWFDSGSTHAFVLERRADLATRRRFAGGEDAVLYLEGSDQHRGWFQSSLLESCGTRGRAPYDAVLTHGFVVGEDGRKMSKSLGNVVAPQDVIDKSGAEILRLWAVSSDYAEDLRIGPEILKSNVDAYRKLRNTLRFLIGNLYHYEESLRVAPDAMPELERYVLHRLYELDAQMRHDYEAFDFKRVFHSLFTFCVNDLSAFYFDVRKDALYCEPYDSVTRRAALTVLDELFSCLSAWFAPLMCFTMEEAWLARHPGSDSSVHLRLFPELPGAWKDDALAEKWRKVRQVRRVVTGALEVERREKRIGASLEAAPDIYIADAALYEAVRHDDWAEIAITSQAHLIQGAGPAEAFRLDDVAGVAVAVKRAEGRKCARSWKISPDVGADPDFADLSERDAKAVRQFDARARQGGAHVA